MFDFIPPRDLVILCVIICSGFYLIPMLVQGILSASAAFVTRGESYALFYDKFMDRFGIIMRDMYSDPFDLVIAGIIHGICGMAVGMVLGFFLVWSSFTGLIVIGTVVGLLFTARFAYTLYSKFIKHIKDLHKVQDDDFKVKW